MTNQPLFPRAKNFTTAHLGLADQQIHALIVLLLEGLLDEIGDARQASLVIRANAKTHAVDDQGSVYAQVWDTSDPGDIDPKRIETSAHLDDGQTVTLIAGAGDDPQRTEEVCRRCLGPILASLKRRGTLEAVRNHARDAVTAVENSESLDLATGVVMARTRLDPRSARSALNAWSERTGQRIDALSSAAVLALRIDEGL